MHVYLLTATVLFTCLGSITVKTTDHDANRIRKKDIAKSEVSCISVVATHIDQQKVDLRLVYKYNCTCNNITNLKSFVSS